MSHTPTPWITTAAKQFVKANNSTIICELYGIDNESAENGRRIVECVNACAPFEDPITSIPKMLLENEQLKARIVELEEEIFIKDELMEGLKTRITELDNPSWISVKEKIPKPLDEDYLVLVKNKNKSDGIFLFDCANFSSDGIWIKCKTWEDVTHWKPLPPKPQL